MTWTIVDSPNNNQDDVPESDFRVSTHHGVHHGDLVVFGLATTPVMSAYVATDNTPGGSLAWVPLGPQDFGVGSTRVLLWYALAAAAVNPLSIVVTPGLGESASYVMVIAVYRHRGSIFADQSVGGFGVGNSPIAAPFTPAGADELAVAFGVGKPDPGFATADSPLYESYVSRSSLVLGCCWGDALSVNAPFTPTMHTSLSGDWGILAVTFGANVPPPTNQPGQFLGSGLEPFPIRRKGERRQDHSSRHRRRRFGTNLIK